jgi:hypothetical protein
LNKTKRKHPKDGKRKSGFGIKQRKKEAIARDLYMDIGQPLGVETKQISKEIEDVFWNYNGPMGEDMLDIEPMGILRFDVLRELRAKIENKDKDDIAKFKNPKEVIAWLQSYIDRIYEYDSKLAAIGLSLPENLLDDLYTLENSVDAYRRADELGLYSSIEKDLDKMLSDRAVTVRKEDGSVATHKIKDKDVILIKQFRLINKSLLANNIKKSDEYKAQQKAFKTVREKSKSASKIAEDIINAIRNGYADSSKIEGAKIALSNALDKNGNPLYTQRQKDVYLLAVSTGYKSIISDAFDMKPSEYKVFDTYLSSLESMNGVKKEKAAPDLASLYVKPASEVERRKISLDKVSERLISAISSNRKLNEVASEYELAESDLNSYAKLTKIYGDNLAAVVKRYLEKRDLEKNVQRYFREKLKFNSDSTDASVVSSLAYIAQLVNPPNKNRKTMIEGTEAEKNNGVILKSTIDNVNKTEEDAGFSLGENEIDVFRFYGQSEVAVEAGAMAEVPMSKLVDLILKSSPFFDSVRDNIEAGIPFTSWNTSNKMKLADITKIIQSEGKRILSEKKVLKSAKNRKLASSMVGNLVDLSDVIQNGFVDYINAKYKTSLLEGMDFDAQNVPYGTLVAIYNDGKGSEAYTEVRGVKEKLDITDTELESRIPRESLVNMILDKYRYDVIANIAQRPNTYFSELAQKDFSSSVIESLKADVKNGDGIFEKAGAVGATIKDAKSLKALLDLAVTYTIKPQSLMKMLDGEYSDTRFNELDYTGAFSNFFLKDAWKLRNDEINNVKARYSAANEMFEKIFGFDMSKRYVDGGFSNAVSVPLGSGTKEALSITRSELIGIYSLARCGEKSSYYSLIDEKGTTLTKRSLTCLSQTLAPKSKSMKEQG